LTARRAWPWLVAVLAAAGCSAATAAASAGDQGLDALGRCVARLDPQTDIGHDRIVSRCPDLASQLDRAPWSAWLPGDWKRSGNDLSAASLKGLRSLVTRELQTRPGAQALQVASLQPILGRLDLPSDDQGVWSRFKEWLREVFAPREPDTGNGWLARFFGAVNVSDAVARLISWACLAVVVVLAAAIITNELRVTGVFTRRRSTGKPNRRPDPPRLPSSIDWEDVQRAAPGERPRLLLQLISARLVALGSLPPAEGLTVRELVNVARLADSGDRALLVDIAMAAERVRFSGDRVSIDSIEAALAHGRTLLEHLEAGR